MLGLVVGVGVAYGLQGLFSAIGAEIPTEGLVLLPRTIIVGLVIGVLVTVVAGLAPAIRASRIPPMAALRDDIALPARSLHFRAIAGAILLVAGLAAMTAGAAVGGGSGSQLVGLGVVAALIGAIVVSPALAGPMVRILGFAFPRMFGTVGSLAVQNAERQPRRTAATASALMIGLALVSALTIFATSAKSSITEVIDSVVGADFLVTNQTQRPFGEEVAQTVADRARCRHRVAGEARARRSSRSSRPHSSASTRRPSAMSSTSCSRPARSPTCRRAGWSSTRRPPRTADWRWGIR